jgi:hypothetical protein
MNPKLTDKRKNQSDPALLYWSSDGDYSWPKTGILNWPLTATTGTSSSRSY